jgi:hypothetical protein
MTDACTIFAPEEHHISCNVHISNINHELVDCRLPAPFGLGTCEVDCEMRVFLNLLSDLTGGDVISLESSDGFPSTSPSTVTIRPVRRYR